MTTNLTKKKSALVILFSNLLIIAIASSAHDIGVKSSSGYEEDDMIPFEIGDVNGSDIGSMQITNSTVSDDSTTEFSNDNTPELGCDMPPCPPGNACIQSCP